MSGYKAFAYVYDRLTQNVNYKERADYICSLLAGCGIKAGILLDLACGTGSMAELFAARGYDVIGVDISEEMLAQAQQKKYEKGLDILYLRQDMRSLDLFGSIKCAVCSLDSINHLASAKDVGRAFYSVGFFMEKNGILIFDVNTAYKHKNILADNTFIYDMDDVYCVWQNRLDNADGHVDIHLDVFEADGELYARFDEDITEYCYDDETLTALLQQSNFEVLARYGELTTDAPQADEQRVYYVCRKLKDQ
ncbi:MAG: class I SAM-dependent methyltransferase [Clostridia bacterium]|nr:class I SAM-dependent methyltransferase [Clostridia bacterium]